MCNNADRHPRSSVTMVCRLYLTHLMQPNNQTTCVVRTNFLAIFLKFKIVLFAISKKHCATTYQLTSKQYRQFKKSFAPLRTAVNPVKTNQQMGTIHFHHLQLLSHQNFAAFLSNVAFLHILCFTR